MAALKLRRQSEEPSETTAPSGSAQQLREWRDRGDVDSLSSAALDASNGDGTRWFATRYLGEFEDETAVVTLSTLLGDPNWRIRQQAARSLRELGPVAERSVGDLARALFDGDGEVRVAASRALGAIGDPSAIPDLVKVAETTSWDTLHAWATESLVLLGAHEASAHLLRRLQSRKAWQRRWAARQLRTVGEPNALKPLREARKQDLLHRRTYTAAIKAIQLRASKG